MLAGGAVLKNQHDQGRRDGKFVLSTPTEVENELPFQLIGAGCDFYQYPIDRPFGFPVFQWIQTTSGNGVLVYNGQEMKVGDHEGMLLYPEVSHRYHAIEEPWYVNWITFSGHHIESMLQYADMRRTGVYRISEASIVESLIRKAFHTLASNYPLKGVDGSVIVYELLLGFLKYARLEGAESRNTHVMRLKPALDLIEREMHRPLSLHDLAESIGVTPQYFCELFRIVTSRRPTEYVNQRRIDRAKEILYAEPNTRISEIAHRVGFESDSYFSTVFRRMEGVSPRQYRETKTGVQLDEYNALFARRRQRQGDGKSIPGVH